MALETLNEVKQIDNFTLKHLDSAVPREEYLSLLEKYWVIHGRANNTLIFKLQDGPIPEAGLNGCRVDTIVAAAIKIIEGLNVNVPCMENERALNYLERAYDELKKRILDRSKRCVKGTYDA